MSTPTQNADTPREGQYQRLFWVMFSAMSAGTLAIVGTFITMMINVATLSTTLDNLQHTVVEIKADLVSSSQKRYTSDQASSDRSSMMALVNELQATNRDQESVIRELLQFKARAEERLRLANSKAE